MSNKNCPICGGRLNVVPAGVSKTSGKPYPAFYSCPAKCNLRGVMDTRVDAPTWDKDGFIPRQTSQQAQSPTQTGNNDLLIEVNAKLDRILEILQKEMPSEGDWNE
jgi:hypothetical protein